MADTSFLSWENTPAPANWLKFIVPSIPGAIVFQKLLAIILARFVVFG